MVGKYKYYGLIRIKVEELDFLAHFNDFLRDLHASAKNDIFSNKNIIYHFFPGVTVFKTKPVAPIVSPSFLEVTPVVLTLLLKCKDSCRSASEITRLGSRRGSRPVSLSY